MNGLVSQQSTGRAAKREAQHHICSHPFLSPARHSRKTVSANVRDRIELKRSLYFIWTNWKSHFSGAEYGRMAGK